MFVSKISKKPCPRLISKYSKCYATQVVRSEDEYTTVPHYPPILDASYKAKFERKKESEYEEIKTVKTVEEKQIKLNMPKYYGFKTYLFPEEIINYNNLNLIQYVSRTHFKEVNELPQFYSHINVDDAVNQLKQLVEEALILEIDGYKRIQDLKEADLTETERENIISSSLCKQINRIVINHLSEKHQHFVNTQLDYDPRIESTWYAGGMNPPENIKRYRKGVDWRKDTENDPTNRLLMYLGNPILTLRANKPLLPILPNQEATNPDYIVPEFKYDPRVVGIKTDHRRITNIPGFWPGDPHQFGLLSIHKRGYMLKRKFNDAQDDQESLHGQAILSSFAWLNAQANFLGFNSFNEITYPLVTQTIISNGKLWSFYIYQLNTLLMHSKYANENEKRNLCWGTKELKLYDNIENDKIVGLNENVLKMIIQLYSNVPEERLGVNMTPYLNHKEKLAADYEDDEKRDWLEREYKFLTSNRPRHKLPFELYHWEKIYKVDHKTRFMEARRRPFELREKPFDRKLNERKPKYIPRCLRPDLPRNKGRNAKEYFP